ncbi:MAG: hypothetical protein RIQ54_178 [Candidatus Parcubacteria bacterium]|jgi:8-oxo-dGTP pyrophosphatase MutT (NUDIX family)
MRKEITTGIIVFRRVREGIKFLILYHGHQYWNFPKGHIENEEQSLEAAYRETFEETGLRQEELRLVRNFKTYERFTFRRNGQTVYKIVILYLAQTNNPIVKISKEHQGYGWFFFEDAKKILGMHKDSQKVLQNAYDFLMRRQKKEITAEGPHAPGVVPPKPVQHQPHNHSTGMRTYAREANYTNNKQQQQPRQYRNHHEKSHRNIYRKSHSGGRFNSVRPNQDIPSNSQRSGQ